MRAHFLCVFGKHVLFVLKTLDHGDHGINAVEVCGDDFGGRNGDVKLIIQCTDELDDVK